MSTSNKQGRSQEGPRGLKHPLGSGVVLENCPNSRLFSLGSGGSSREMPKLEISTSFGPVLATPLTNMLVVSKLI